MVRLAPQFIKADGSAALPIPFLVVITEGTPPRQREIPVAEFIASNPSPDGLPSHRGARAIVESYRTPEDAIDHIIPLTLCLERQMELDPRCIVGNPATLAALHAWAAVYEPAEVAR